MTSLLFPRTLSAASVIWSLLTLSLNLSLAWRNLWELGEEGGAVQWGTGKGVRHTWQRDRVIRPRTESERHGATAESITQHTSMCHTRGSQHAANPPQSHVSDHISHSIAHILTHIVTASAPVGDPERDVDLITPSLSLSSPPLPDPLQRQTTQQFPLTSDIKNTHHIS